MIGSSFLDNCELVRSYVETKPSTVLFPLGCLFHLLYPSMVLTDDVEGMVSASPGTIRLKKSAILAAKLPWGKEMPQKDHDNKFQKEHMAIIAQQTYLYIIYIYTINLYCTQYTPGYYYCKHLQTSLR